MSNAVHPSMQPIIRLEKSLLNPNVGTLHLETGEIITVTIQSKAAGFFAGFCSLLEIYLPETTFIFLKEAKILGCQNNLRQKQNTLSNF